MSGREIANVFCELCYIVHETEYLGEIRCIEKGENYECNNPKHEQDLKNASVLMSWYRQGKIRGL